jgi:hypothetical protein
MTGGSARPVDQSEAPRASGHIAVSSRITAGGGFDLARFQDSGALAGGQVNLIALDAVVERLGERWQSRREAIYDMVERVLERKVGPNGYFARVSETDFLVAQPDLGPFGAQASCLRSLGEILKHFLGSAAHHDLRVRRVTDISSTQIIAVPVDPKAAIQGDAQELRQAAADAQAATLRAQAEMDPTLLSPERWSPFIGAHGRKVRVSCRLEPVFELKNNGRIGYRLSRSVIDTATDEPLSKVEVGNLSRADHLRIDMATIARGLARVESSSETEQALSLIIPVSFVTLSHQQGRQMLAQAFARARQAVLRGVLCEVCDIEGVPQVALLTAVSLIRPWSLMVIGHLSDAMPRADSGMKEAGLQAMSFTCPLNLDGDAEFLGWAREAIRSAQKVSRSTMVYGCTARRLAMAGLMGATHASVAG